MTYPTLSKTEWVEGPKDGDRSVVKRDRPAFFEAGDADMVHAYAFTPARDAMLYLGLVMRAYVSEPVEPLVVGER